MGAVACCNPINPYEKENTYIYQINRYNKCIQQDSSILPESKREIISSKSSTITNTNSTFHSKYNNKKQYLRNKNGEFILLSYEIKKEYFFEIKVIFPIIRTIEGMSELNMGNKIILCGIPPKQKDEGSFLLQINLDKRANEDTIKADILINSRYPHIYPSLIHNKNEKILCIGGKGQISCELYDLNINKWFSLPELPEQRYKCTLCLDSKAEFVYLFGGTNNEINNKDKENNESIKILRMNLIKQLIWENLIVKNTQKNLIINRSSSGAFTYKYDEDFIFIVGGQDSNDNYLDNVLRFSIKNLKFESTDVKLNNKAIFTNQSGVSLNEQTQCLIDSLNNVHLIERHDCLPMEYHIDEI